MSKYFKLSNLPSGQSWESNPIFGKARGSQPHAPLQSLFDEPVLFYLEERVINHLLDSFTLNKYIHQNIKDFNDFSFFTAPAYKALEGFLFQIAKDLNLPSSGNSNLAGSYYFDEGKIDKHIDSLIKEIEKTTEDSKKLSSYEKRDIKDRIREMKGFLRNYRNTPSHFYGESIDTIEKADRNVKIIYGTIDNTTKLLLRAGLLSINAELH